MYGYLYSKLGDYWTINSWYNAVMSLLTTGSEKLLLFPGDDGQTTSLFSTAVLWTILGQSWLIGLIR